MRGVKGEAQLVSGFTGSMISVRKKKTITLYTFPGSLFLSLWIAALSSEYTEHHLKQKVDDRLSE